MKRLALATLVFLGASAAAQVSIDLPKSKFGSGQLIPASVSNQGKEPVSFCVEFGQWSYHNDQIETTPIPFVVQAPVRRQWKHLFRKRWQALLIAPDIGSIRVAVTVDPGKHHEFPFRLEGQAAKLRLLLYYWLGERAGRCSPPANRDREIISREFQILPEPEVQ